MYFFIIASVPKTYISTPTVSTWFSKHINTHSLFQYFERRFSRRLRLFGATLFVLKAVSWSCHIA